MASIALVAVLAGLAGIGLAALLGWWLIGCPVARSRDLPREGWLEDLTAAERHAFERVVAVAAVGAGCAVLAVLVLIWRQ